MMNKTNFLAVAVIAAAAFTAVPAANATVAGGMSAATATTTTAATTTAPAVSCWRMGAAMAGVMAGATVIAVSATAAG